MGSLELLIVIVSSAAILGLILGLFTVYNRWAIRKEISKRIREINERTQAADRGDLETL